MADPELWGRCLHFWDAFTSRFSFGPLRVGLGAVALEGPGDLAPMLSLPSLHCAVACGILVPRVGIEPGPPAVGVQSPNHWEAWSQFLIHTSLSVSSSWEA